MQTPNASKLEVVVNCLGSNPNVVIISRREDVFLNENYWRTPIAEPKSYAHTIAFRVAPKQGLYTVEELQAFMDDLVPNLEPFEKGNFKKDGWLFKYLYCGNLHYSEEVGHETRGIKITNKYGLETHMANGRFGDDGIKIFPETSELKLYRLISVWIFPHAGIAQGGNTISLKELNKYQHSNPR